MRKPRAEVAGKIGSGHEPGATLIYHGANRAAQNPGEPQAPAHGQGHLLQQQAGHGHGQPHLLQQVRHDHGQPHLLQQQAAGGRKADIALKIGSPVPQNAQPGHMAAAPQMHPEPSCLSPERDAWVSALQRELDSTRIHMGALQTRMERLQRELDHLTGGYHPT